MVVFTQKFQNFPPGLSPFMYQWVFMAAEPPVNLGKGVQRKWPFSPPRPLLCSWYLTGVVFASHHPWSSYRKGWAGGKSTCRSWRRREQAVRNKTP